MDKVHPLITFAQQNLDITLTSSQVKILSCVNMDDLTFSTQRHTVENRVADWGVVQHVLNAYVDQFEEDR